MVRAAHLLLAAVPGTAQTAEHVYFPGNESGAERACSTRDCDSYRGCGDVQLHLPVPREELAALARKGVKVRVYRDHEQFSQETQWSGITTTGMLHAAGIEVRVKGAKDLMHLKSYVIDGRLLRTGSANWSPTGLKRQDNDVLYESSPVAVERFERKFEEIWGRAGNTECTVPQP